MDLLKKPKKDKEDPDFEISFLEGLINKEPDFIQALIVLAEAYTKKGDIQKGLALDLRLSRLRGDDPEVHYNLACSYSLAGQVEEALATIKKAVLLGYDDFAYMLSDPDLSNLREDRRFNSLFNRFKR